MYLRLNKRQWSVMITAIILCVWISKSSFDVEAYKATIFRNPVGKQASRKSPLSTTAAFIRYNSERLNRIETLDRYEPFFHSIHHSMPKTVKNYTEAFDRHKTNLRSDNHASNYVVYEVLAQYMSILLEQQSQVEGILYFHFDAWIDPAGFESMDYQKIWFPKSSNARPFHTCFTYKEEEFLAQQDYPYTWWAFRKENHRGPLWALSNLSSIDAFSAASSELCVGWADIFYIPKRFFADFILLTEMFEKYRSFHEIAVATMIHIIDQNYRRSHKTSAISYLEDCWGDCCARNPTLENIDNHRCGHKIDWQDPEMSHRVLARLDERKVMYQDEISAATAASL